MAYLIQSNQGACHGRTATADSIVDFAPASADRRSAEPAAVGGENLVERAGSAAATARRSTRAPTNSLTSASARSRRARARLPLSSSWQAWQSRARQCSATAAQEGTDKRILSPRPPLPSSRPAWQNAAGGHYPPPRRAASRSDSLEGSFSMESISRTAATSAVPSPAPAAGTDPARADDWLRRPVRNDCVKPAAPTYVGLYVGRHSPRSTSDALCVRGTG